MNAEQLRGKWNQFKGSVKQQWAKLTDDDIAAVNGDRDKLIGRIQERYGITKEKAEQQFNDWKVASASTTAEDEMRKRQAS